jgi:hypothetical protein
MSVDFCEGSAFEEVANELGDGRLFGSRAGAVFPYRNDPFPASISHALYITSFREVSP